MKFHLRCSKKLLNFNQNRLKCFREIASMLLGAYLKRSHLFFYVEYSSSKDTDRYFLYQWLYSPFVGPCPLFQFFHLYTVGRTPWEGDQPVARPLLAQRTTQTQNKRTQISMPGVGFEPTIPAFERAKTVIHKLANTEYEEISSNRSSITEQHVDKLIPTRTY
jgi:hypothetical protein